MRIGVGMAMAVALGATSVPAAAPATAPALPQPQVVFHRKAGSNLPFSHSVRVGDVLYLSGMIGMSPDGQVPAEIGAQTKVLMSNIAKVLALSGNHMGDIFKCTVAMRDLRQWEAFNTVFTTYFRADRLPAQTTIGAADLVYGAAVEVECLAVARTDGRLRRGG